MIVLPSKRRDFINQVIDTQIDDCIIWPFAVRKSNGYGAYDISIEGKKKNFDIHNFVCRIVHGEPEKGEQAAHSCGQKLCINPKHLRWTTPLENMQDAKNHGTLIGGGRYRQRIFAPQRAEIVSSRESLVTIGARFGIPPAYAGWIRRRG